MKLRSTPLAWALAAGLFVSARCLAPAPQGYDGGVPPGAVRRLAGPFAGLLSDVWWIRFDRARMKGRIELALAHAETALWLDPRETEAWELLASYLALNLASVESEPDPAQRRAWVEAGLGVAERGEALARDPAALVFLQGLLLQVKADTDPDLGWPGGSAALWGEAEARYLRAASLGHPQAALAAGYAREKRDGD